MTSSRDRVALEGAICGVAFASGDRFVLGLWDRGPLGPMQDVMWAQPDGTRVLLTPTEEVATFVSSIYRFDLVRTASFGLDPRGDGFTLSAGDLTVIVSLGAERRVFALRPRPLRRSLAWVRVEDVLMRRLVGRFVLGGAEGVRAYGTTSTGVRQWYRIDAYRRVAAASASIGGRDLGTLRPLEGPMAFGFSEFPREPAYVTCSPVLEGVSRIARLGRLSARSRS